MRCTLLRPRILFAVSVLGCFLAALPPAAGGQAVAGRLLDGSTGGPIALARVTLVDLHGHPVVFTVTDTEGNFLLTAGQPGDYWLSAQSLFYWEYFDGPLSLTTTDTVVVEFALTPNPLQLEGLIVKGERRPWRMVAGGYYDREKSGLGWHLDREKIERHAFRRISDVLFTVPGVRLYDTGFGDKEPMFARAGGWGSLLNRSYGSTCFPRVFVDGMLWSWGEQVPTDIDRLLHPDEVEAMEIYTSPMEVPGRFGGLGARCGVIALWTR
jgi:hypothetical protein